MRSFNVYGEGEYRVTDFESVYRSELTFSPTLYIGNKTHQYAVDSKSRR